MTQFCSTTFNVALRYGCLAVVLGANALAGAQTCPTCEPSILDGPSAYGAMADPHADVRVGGVLAESYGYHRQGEQPYTIMPPDGAYRWGFPVPSYRWGWFGAERYYPRVAWRYDYYNECVRWAYRNGF